MLTSLDARADVPAMRGWHVPVVPLADLPFRRGSHAQFGDAQFRPLYVAFRYVLVFISGYG